MPELNELGQMTPAVKHAHEKRMENYKIQMRSYTEAKKLDRDCGAATRVCLLQYLADVPRKETELSMTV
jgi:hypothetical protein